MRSTFIRSLFRFLAIGLILVAFAESARAVRSGRWEFKDRAAYSKSKVQGFEISQEGRIRDGLSATTSVSIPADYVWSIVETEDRVYLGTGDGAKIYMALKNKSGGIDSEVEVAWEGDGLEVYTLALLPDGNLAAGVSPIGTLLILAEAETGLTVIRSETIEDSYIWRILSVDDDLWLATGSGRTGIGGGIYRWRDGNMDLMHRADDPHVLSLARSGNRIFAGTQGQQGVVLAVDAIASKSPRISVAYDPSQNEIVDIIRGTDSAVYVMALAQSARPSARVENPPVESGEEEEEEPAAPRPTPTPQAEGGNAIYRIDPSGRVEEWIRARTAIRAMHSGRFGLLAANSDQGQVFRIDGPSQSSLMLALDEKLLLSITDKFVGTGKPAMLHQYARAARGGFIRSESLDAKTQGEWGVLSYDASGEWELRTRSGNSETPSGTWSAWSLPITGTGMRIESPMARYLQVEIRHAEPDRDAGEDYLRDLSITYQIANRMPRIVSVSVKPVSFEPRNLTKLSRSGPIGQIVNSFAQAAKTASSQAAAASSEYTLEELLRPFAGLMHVTWTAEEPDGDKMRAKIEVIDESTSRRMLVAEDFDGDGYLLNTNNFPDGRYSAVVTIHDALDNDPGKDKFATRSSDDFLVDNQPPVITVSAKSGFSDGRIELSGVARDEAGRISAIWYYDEDGKWKRLPPDDGIADQPEELFHVTRPSSGRGAGSSRRAIVFKATDQNGNVGYARVSF